MSERQIWWCPTHESQLMIGPDDQAPDGWICYRSWLDEDSKPWLDEDSKPWLDEDSKPCRPNRMTLIPLSAPKPEREGEE